MTTKEDAYKELDELEEMYGETEITAIRSALKAAVGVKGEPEQGPAPGNIGPPVPMTPAEQREDEILQHIMAGRKSEAEAIRFRPAAPFTIPGTIGENLGGGKT